MTTERRAQRGYTLLEVIFAMAIFGLFLTVLLVLTAEMRFWEKRLPINMHKNPQVINVLARLRRDVQDAWVEEPYKNEHGPYTASEKVLIIQTMMPNGGRRTVVWDFRTPRQVLRREYNVGIYEDWVSRGLPPDFNSVEIDAEEICPTSGFATRIKAKDEKGRLAIDTILQPRAVE